MVKAGILGTGKTIGMAGAHLADYKEVKNAQLTAIYDINAQMANDFCEKHDLDKALICENIEEFWSKIDALSICTPNHTHVDYVKKAIKNGKHVLCEKPLSVIEDDLEELNRICNETSLVTAIDFNYRFIPGFITARNLIKAGVLGDIYFYRHIMGGDRFNNNDIILEWRTDRKRSGPGSFADFGSHILDMFEFLIGIDELEDFKLIENTFIKERNLDGEKHKVSNDDVSAFIAKGKSGIIASFMTSRVGGLGNQLEIVGSEASIIFADNEIKIRYKGKPGGGFPAFVPYEGEHLAPDDGIKGPRLRTCVPSFINAIENGGQPSTDISYGIKIQKLLFDIESQVL